LFACATIGLLGIVDVAVAAPPALLVPLADSKPATRDADSRIFLYQSHEAAPCLVVIRVSVRAFDGSVISTPDDVTSLSADLSGLPQGHDATFVTNATNTEGTFVWHPAEGMNGQYTVVFSATANREVTFLKVATPSTSRYQALGRFEWKPTAADIGSFKVTFAALSSEGETSSLEWPLTVIDQRIAALRTAQIRRSLSGQALTRGPIMSLYPSCSDADTGGAGGSSCNDAETDTVVVGSYFPSDRFGFTIGATDPEGGSITSFTADTSQLPPNNDASFLVMLGPRADAGGPYSGTVGVPVEFNGIGSYSPDGAPVDMYWDFGDGEVGTVPFAERERNLHTYRAAGTYRVTLLLRDLRGLMSDCDVTSVVITALPARAFVAGGNRTTPDGPASRSLCIQIEPMNGDYDNSQVNTSTIAMYSGRPGTTGHIMAVSGKTVLQGDRDRNGIEEITACFDREDISTLFGDAKGRKSVPAKIVAQLLDGQGLEASLELNIGGTGSSLAGSVHPNPLHGVGSVTFETSKPGPVKILLFNMNGRLVRTLLAESNLGSGHHEIPIDAVDDRRARLSSGIYFYRVLAPEGIATGRLVIVE
jgi:hypothetical protein